MTSSSARHRPEQRADGRAARWAGQRERRRGEFVDAALRAIAEHGPEVSTEQIAGQAGVARTGLYKYFTDNTDLQGAIADRAVELITAELTPVWNSNRTPMQMITIAIGAHINWLSGHGNLYRYLTKHSLAARNDGRDVVTDAKTAIAQNLAVLFEYYLAAFGLNTKIASTIGFGIVGLVEASTAHWLETSNGMSRAELRNLLSSWVWRLLSETLRDEGVELAPDQQLPSRNLNASNDSGPA